MSVIPPRGRRGNGQRLLPAPAPAPVPPADPVLALIERVARDPSADLDKLQRLLDMRAKAEADANERAFNDAMAAVQKKLTPIMVDATNEQTSSKYATYVALDRVVRPVYTDHGFALTFTAGERSTDTAVEIVAYLTGHGHGRRYTVTMPADGLGPKGSPVMSRTHAASSAITYGMRRLLTMIFNLAIDKDDDGNGAGRTSNGVVTQDQLRHINRLATQVKADVRRFCAYLQVPTLADIPADRYQHAVAALEAKGRARTAQQKTARP